MPFGLPFLKLAPVLFKFVSDPLKARFKTYVKESPWWRERIIRMARFSNETTVKLRFLQNDIKRTPEQIKKASVINEAKAIEMGVEIVNSFVNTMISIFLLGAVLYWTQLEEKDKKAKAHEEKIKQINLLTSYGETLGDLTQNINDLNQKMENIDQRLSKVEDKMENKLKKIFSQKTSNKAVKPDETNSKEIDISDDVIEG